MIVTVDWISDAVAEIGRADKQAIDPINLRNIFDLDSSLVGMIRGSRHAYTVQRFLRLDLNNGQKGAIGFVQIVPVR